nr:hypothetical protein [uncultured Butyrivibrio sp.]
MEKTEIVFQERRQKPQGYHCPACGTELKKSSSKEKNFDDQARCRKCGRTIIIQQRPTWLMTFTDRRSQCRG